MISFLQSQVWADFQKSINRKIWRLDEVLVIKHNLLFNKSYFYSPRLRLAGFGLRPTKSPSADEVGGQARCEDWINKIKQIAKQENAIFLKIEPVAEINKKFGLHKSKDVQPRKTSILDITKSEQELLRQMHYKTRYNIGLAEKKGILIKKDKNKFEDFWRLIQETTKRDGFRPHPKEYYRKMLEISDVELFLADFKNKIIAANIVVFYEKQAIYLHGASDYEYRNLMAPFLLQWNQILEAKKRGCTKYDFWGIDEKKWPGVTRFKKGFGGHEISYPGAYDLVFQPMWYKIYKIARKIL